MRSFRPYDLPVDRCVTGPHGETTSDGTRRLIWRCGLCGTESTDPALEQGCWNCDVGVAWR